MKGRRGGEGGGGRNRQGQSNHNTSWRLEVKGSDQAETPPRARRVPETMSPSTVRVCTRTHTHTHTHTSRVDGEDRGVNKPDIYLLVVGAK